MVKNNFAMMTQYFNPSNQSNGVIICYFGSNYYDHQHAQGGLFQKSLQWTGPNVGAKTGFTFLALIFVTRMRLKPQEI
jgi:hypothetical protein